MGKKKPRRTGTPVADRDKKSAKHGGGLLMGMRSGVQKTVKGATGIGETAAEGKKKAGFVSNAITVLLFIAAGVMLLRRCGYIHF
jgi:hypothetical protein